MTLCPENGKEFHNKQETCTKGGCDIVRNDHNLLGRNNQCSKNWKGNTQRGRRQRYRRLVICDTKDTRQSSSLKTTLKSAVETGKEFQWCTNNRTNSFVENRRLFLKPTMTAETIGEAAVRNGFTLSIWGSDPASLCTGNQNWGCERTRGAGGSILNPIQSAAVRTVNSFSGKFFNMEVRAKLPVGDWIWPAIWLLPRFNAYGGWPCSGEIDVMESRRNYPSYPPGGYNQVGSALHWGPYWAQNGYQKTLGTWELQPVRGTCNRWGNRFANPWKGSASNATPFDQVVDVYEKSST
eukprot:g436.t1